MLWRRIVASYKERLLITRYGRFREILRPGEQRVFAAPEFGLEIERHDMRDLLFKSTWAVYLNDHRPATVQHYFTRVETNHLEIAMVYANGELCDVILPAKCVLFWREPARITAEHVAIVDEPELPEEMLPVMEKLAR